MEKTITDHWILSHLRARDAGAGISLVENFPQLDDFREFCFQNLESKDVAPQNNPVEKGRVTVIKTMNACLVLCVVTITVNSLVSTTTRRMTAVYLVCKMNFGTEFLGHHV